MLDKIKNLDQYYKHAQDLRDVRVAGMIVFAFIVLLITWSGAKAIETNYQLQKQISTLQQKNAVSELSNKNSKLENDYYKTDQFLELSARQNFGLANPGETELLVPKDVALAYTTAPPQQTTEKAKAAVRQPAYQKNLQAWVNFFLHRKTIID